MCTWINIWDIRCWWEYMILELRDGLVMVDLFLVHKSVCVDGSVGLEIMWWLYDIIVNCWVVILYGSLFVPPYKRIISINKCWDGSNPGAGCNTDTLMHTYIASILHTFHTIAIVLFKVCGYHNTLVRDLHVQ